VEETQPEVVIESLKADCEVRKGSVRGFEGYLEQRVRLSGGGKGDSPEGQSELWRIPLPEPR
jgi:hypothetical protein